MNSFLEYVSGESLAHRMNPVAKLILRGNFRNRVLLRNGRADASRAFGVGLRHCGELRHDAPNPGRAPRRFWCFPFCLPWLSRSPHPRAMFCWRCRGVNIGTGGLLLAALTVVRLVAAAIPLFLLFYVTKMSDLSNSVVKVLHVPYKYAFTFTSTVHFIPVFLNDMRSIMEAQTARGVQFDQGGIMSKVRLIVPLCVPLLVSSVRKTNSTAIAAEVRGFNLRTRESGCKEYPFAAIDVAALVLAFVLLAVAIVL